MHNVRNLLNDQKTMNLIELSFDSYYGIVRLTVFRVYTIIFLPNLVIDLVY